MVDIGRKLCVKIFHCWEYRYIFQFSRKNKVVVILWHRKKLSKTHHSLQLIYNLKDYLVYKISKQLLFSFQFSFKVVQRN